MKLNQRVRIDGKHYGYIVGSGSVVDSKEIRTIYIVDIDYYDNGLGFQCKNDQGETYISKLVVDPSAIETLD